MRKRNKRSIPDTLPNTLYSLFKLALKDYDRLIKNPKFNFDMMNWYVPIHGDQTCQICLAGGIIALQLGDGKYSLIPDDFCKTIDAKLQAINALRLGHVGEAAVLLYAHGVGSKAYRKRWNNIGWNYMRVERHPSEYKYLNLPENQAKKFRKSMNKVLKYLKDNRL